MEGRGGGKGWREGVKGRGGGKGWRIGMEGRDGGKGGGKVWREGMEGRDGGKGWREGVEGRGGGKRHYCQGHHYEGKYNIIAGPVKIHTCNCQSISLWTYVTVNIMVLLEVPV